MKQEDYSYIDGLICKSELNSAYHLENNLTSLI